MTVMFDRKFCFIEKKKQQEENTAYLEKNKSSWKTIHKGKGDHCVLSKMEGKSPSPWEEKWDVQQRDLGVSS